MMPTPPAAALLPLSWAYTPGLAVPVFRTVGLKLSGLRWVYAADLPPGTPFADAWATLRAQSPGGVLIRGVGPAAVRMLQAQGGHYAITGREPILPLHTPLMARRSVRELIRRGDRRGQAFEMPIGPEAEAQLQALFPHSSVAGRPRLRHLFRTELNDCQRLFVFRPTGGAGWWVAISLTMCGPRNWHVELMLRHRDTPVGVMAATLNCIHTTLAAEGHTTLSLGEVPFHGYTAGWSSRVMARVGRSIRFAYNADTLYQFKNKFRPEWRPLCVVATEPVNLLMLTDMFFASRVHRVVASKLF